MPVNRKLFEEIFPASREDWRKWLSKNHTQKESVWLVIAKKGSDLSTLTVSDAVEEALCFGWIDSVPNKIDESRFKILLSPRKAKSNWSKINKVRVQKLIKAGLMTAAGMKVINEAKKSGAWTALDNVDKLTIPDEMMKLFRKNKKAYEHFKNFPPSTRRGILEWILNAKRPETKQKRIQETVTLAEKNIRANQYRPTKD